MSEEQAALASSEWVNVARTILEESVAQHEETRISFSFCEVFTSSPCGLAKGPDATTAAWHFLTVGKTVTVGEGEIKDADMIM